MSSRGNGSRPARARLRYLRFVLPVQDATSRAHQGVFVEAYRLRRSGSLSGESLDRLEELIDWFEHELAVPSCLRDRDVPRAICWFRPEAHQMLGRMWEMVHLMRELGIVVVLRKTSAPGSVLYRDEHQIVAIPYRRDRLRARRRRSAITADRL